MTTLKLLKYNWHVLLLMTWALIKPWFWDRRRWTVINRPAPFRHEKAEGLDLALISFNLIRFGLYWFFYRWEFLEYFFQSVLLCSVSFLFFYNGSIPPIIFKFSLPPRWRAGYHIIFCPPLNRFLSVAEMFAFLHCCEDEKK